MTAFDNIKTNNWPATSNDFEDFLVLKLVLNDNASLTESLPVVAGSQVLFPKRTLTNTGGVSALSTEGRVWSDTLDTANTNDLPFRSSRTIQDAFGSTSVQVETAINGTGQIIWLDFANNGGAITGSTLKVLGGGVTASLRDVYLNNGSTTSGQLDALLNITGVTVNSIQIKSNASNAGAVIAGIELDGVRLVDPVGGPKKHYANNAVFTAATQPGSGSRLSVDNLDGFSMGSNESWCFEAYINPTQVSDSTLFGVGNSGFAYRIIGGSPYLYVGGTGAILNTGTIPVNTWTHIAVSREGNTLRSFINGTQVGSNTTNTSSWDVTSGTGAGVFIGAANLTNVSPPNYHFDGKIQDLRFYKGVAKYTSNFTPPSAILG